MNHQTFLSRIAETLGCVLFPRVCYFCGSGIDTDESVICSKCRSDVKPVEMPFCSVCGLPVQKFPNSPGDLFCGPCTSGKPFYDKARYGVYYENCVRSSITRFKFNSSLFNARPIAEFLIEAFYRHYVDEQIEVIIPVPVHTKRLVARGFNQVITLSEKLSQATGIPVERTTLAKKINTRPQVGLPRTERMLNIRNAFMVVKPEKISGKRVLIVDDVSTTGATISEAAKAVRKSGAAYIAVLVLALRIKSATSVASISQIDENVLEKCF